MPTANCDQRMSATGYEETELTYNVNEEEQQKVITTHLILFLDPVGSLVSTFWVGGLWVTLLSKIVNFEFVGMC